MLVAWKQNGCKIRHMTSEHKTDSVSVLVAWRESESSLKHATPEHKAGREMRADAWGVYQGSKMDRKRLLVYPRPDGP